MNEGIQHTILLRIFQRQVDYNFLCFINGTGKTIPSRAGRGPLLGNIKELLADEIIALQIKKSKSSGIKSVTVSGMGAQEHYLTLTTTVNWSTLFLK